MDLDTAYVDAPGARVLVHDINDCVPADGPFDRSQALALTNANRHGLSFEWAERIDQHMADNGLVDVHGVHLTDSATGGSLEGRLSHNYVRQIQSSLLRAGIPARTWITTAGRGPTPGSGSGSRLRLLGGAAPAAVTGFAGRASTVPAKTISSPHR